MFKIEQIFIVSLGWARGLFLFCTELFGRNKGISWFHLTYLDGLFIRRKAVAKVGGPRRPKFSQMNLLKSKWDEHFRGVKSMQTPCVNEAALHLTRPPPFPLSL